jgi:hypothetical protein
MRRVGWLLAAAMAVFALAAPAAMADSGTTIYRSTVQPLPGNLPSVGFEATSVSEFGDQITFAHHARRLKSVTVTMSSFACKQGTWFGADCVSEPGAKFSVLITLNLYAALPKVMLPTSNPVLPGSKFASVTQTFRIPYRPSASTKCAVSHPGDWFKNGQCFDALATNITFNLSSLHQRLPNHLVWGVAYNTTHFGYSPIGESAACFATTAGCPYDSLNVSVAPTVKVGSKPYPGTAFQNTSAPGSLCDSTPTLGVFNLDSPTSACWTGFVPAVQFRATS